MKKLVFLTALLFISNIALSQEYLQTGIQWNEQTARQEAFNNIQYKIDLNEFSIRMNDPNYQENKVARKQNIKKFTDREVAFFSAGLIPYGYGVKYADDKFHTFYYKNSGKFDKIDILDKPNDEYPHKSVTYNSNGDLTSTTMHVSKYEQYVYFPNGTLGQHWQGQYCYDGNGNFLMTRKID